MQPSVSIIIPCYNEQATIGALLSAICSQTYPLSRLEVVIADALSEDGTRSEIGRFQRENAPLRIAIVDNPRRTIPSGLNQAIRASSGEIIVRLDAHSKPAPNYVERCVQDLDAGLGENVGGVWTIVEGGTGKVARAIAAAAAHPLGAGDALYRLGGSARAVDTVPFGAFRRSLLDTMGGFDEQLLTNEDYEFNYRIRGAGGRVWLDPAIVSEYVARATLGELAHQYWRYGYWKYRMLRHHPRSLRWRQAIPPILVAAMLALAALALFLGIARVGLVCLIVLYGLTLLAAAVDIAIRRGDIWLMPASAAALATMHTAWGAGFLWSAVRSTARRDG
ncbi:MAG TPA: glycosyltransferase family 2 protein [Anaerolineales bacterium]|nr:glycosyltransferase family 2 protein [Anaerolineales bacterium]